jgi:hypothetical protein
VRKQSDGDALIETCPEASCKELIVPVILDVTNDEQIHAAVEFVRQHLTQHNRKVCRHELTKADRNQALDAGVDYTLCSCMELSTMQAMARWHRLNW